jgi:xanthine/CO dehydrogenase XdhC/CoxF family maturation factor
MSDLYESIIRLANAGEKVAVATIVRTRGSTPREVGARMLVRAGGQIEGTVGGGCGEADVWSEAVDVLATGVPKLIEVDLLHDTDTEGGRACGGIMYVYIEPLSFQPVDETPRTVGQSASGNDGNT